MFVARDKSGTYLLCKGCPERMAAHWRAPSSEYMVINSKFGEKLFPDVIWENEPIEVNVTIGEYAL